MTGAEIDAYLARLVESAPPLAPEQVDRLSTLLRPAPAGAFVDALTDGRPEHGDAA